MHPSHKGCLTSYCFVCHLSNMHVCLCHTKSIICPSNSVLWDVCCPFLQCYLTLCNSPIFKHIGERVEISPKAVTHLIGDISL